MKKKGEKNMKNLNEKEIKCRISGEDNGKKNDGKRGRNALLPWQVRLFVG